MNIMRAAARAALAAATAALVAAAVIPNAAGAAVTGPQPASQPSSSQSGASRLGAVPPGLVLPSHPPALRPGHVTPFWRLSAGEHPAKGPGMRMIPHSIGEPGGYDPAELRAYLGLHGTGAGQTVAVTEAFNVKPSVIKSVANYSSTYGLPPACSATVTTGCFRLKFVAPDGTAASPPIFNWVSWVEEADLDVEMVHALAPRAAIVVVEARDDTVASMMAAVDYAQRRHPAAASNSWGGDETSGEHALDGHCPASGSVCVFAAGDCGNYATSGCPAGSIGGYPAANPNVLAVGGTTLDLADTGKVQSEVGWSGSGGGISADEPLPAYQKGIDHFTGGRGIPDVGFDADPNSGISTYIEIVVTYQGQKVDIGFWQEMGGTSVGAPAWAAILAAAAQDRAAAGKPALTIAGMRAAVYAKGRKPVADITAGANGICGAICTAGPSYDLVTGEGSPRPGIAAYLARH